MAGKVAEIEHDIPVRGGRGWRCSYPLLLGILIVLLGLLALTAAGVGAVHLQLRSLTLSALGRLPLRAEQSVIVFTIRLPRILAAMVVGSALSVSGLLFQALFRNPLAAPYVIGSSGGAVMGASFGVFLLPPISLADFSATALLAFLGAICLITLVYPLANVNGRTPIVALLLAVERSEVRKVQLL